MKNETSEKIEKTCAHCGKTFETTSKKRKYCSASCKQKSYIERKTEPFIFIVVSVERKLGFFRRLLSYIW